MHLIIKHIATVTQYFHLSPAGRVHKLYMHQLANTGAIIFLQPIVNCLPHPPLLQTLLLQATSTTYLPGTKLDPFLDMHQ